ncbi:MAG: HAD-IIIA family hydrolase [Chitinophagales bacterium]
MKAVILAGGKGTRLGHLTAEIPKPMVPILGKPIVERQIELLYAYGITEIILITNHLSQILEDYLGDGSRWNVHISYFVEPFPMGTVGGIKAIEKQLKDDFLVLYGDVMLDMDFHRLIDFHHRHKSDATIVIHPNDHPYDSDLVEVDKNDKVIAFHSKPHPENFYYTNLVNAGVCLFSPIIFNHLEADKKADFGKDIFPVIFQKINMYGYNTPEYIKDMGTLDRLEKVSKDLESGKIARFNLQHQRSAIFLDRDGVINEKRGYVTTPEQLQLFDFVTAAVKKINQSEYLAIVTTNQPIIARGMVTEAALRTILNKMETVLGNNRAKLDGIYYCPHHPDSGFEGEVKELKIDCECRKPKPGMLLKAANDFNIDLNTSYMIGDSWRDIEAGKAAGVTTIGVMTGEGNKDGNSRPDYLFQNLNKAVNFIIDEPYKATFETVLKHIKQFRGKRKKFIIAIGGNSRSGKSTLAKYFSIQLARIGLESSIIALDNWIKPKLERNEEDDVYGRFRHHELDVDLQALFDGASIEIQQPYQHHENQTVEPIEYSLLNEKVVIIEGVVALGLPILLEKAHLKIFVDASEAEHKERLFNYYRWKGYKASIISDIYDKRKVDEFDKIELTKKEADIIAPTLTL